MWRTLFGIAAVAVVLYAAYRPATRSTDIEADSHTIVPQESRQAEAAIRPLSLATFSWRKGGFDNVAFAKFSLTNETSVAIENPTVTCRFYAPNGSIIGAHTITVYDTFPPKKRKRVAELAFGSIDQQVVSAACETP